MRELVLCCHRLLLCILGVLAPLALGASPILAACDPALMYQTIKIAVIQHPPATADEFNGILSKLGPVQVEGAPLWNCENETGSFSAVYFADKRWVHLDYAPGKAEKVPDALLTILAAKAHAEPVGPRWILWCSASRREPRAKGLSAPPQDELTATHSAPRRTPGRRATEPCPIVSFAARWTLEARLSRCNEAPGTQ